MDYITRFCILPQTAGRLKCLYDKYSRTIYTQVQITVVIEIKESFHDFYPVHYFISLVYLIRCLRALSG